MSPLLPRLFELGGVRAAHAVHVAGGQTGGPGQAHVERVEVGALAAEVARLQHGLDVAEPAALDLGIAECVVDDPLVDGAGLGDLRRVALDDLLGGLQYEAVGGNQRGWLEIPPEDGGVLTGHGAGLGDVDEPVARGEPARDLDGRRLLRRRPLGVHEPGVVFLVAGQPRRPRVSLPRIALATEIVGVGHERHGNPRTRHPRRGRGLDPSDHLERAPLRLRTGQREARRSRQPVASRPAETPSPCFKKTRRFIAPPESGTGDQGFRSLQSVPRFREKTNR
jgi:hypothetical protein